ncbi:uncharacterized protein LOC125499450 [Beta vulgaris subsp. vulgaris]|uniref:uncharacterized protein LOC125499450 n=1 Tax=Beta vulgaris subsp. vulgaris TaxID=3555 RepID=UPI002036F8AA|nr:uncharacterized protein LOC125499450 [Beta vulgaris subsp. vulgaris]
MAPFLNTDPLKKAATAATTEDEAYLCRFLANAVSDGSPHAWKLFYTGEASQRLSKEAWEALQTVMKDAENMFPAPACRAPKPRLAKRSSAIKKPVMGKSKARVFEKPPQISPDAIADRKLPWAGLRIGSGALEDSSKAHDMYIEGIDGRFQLATVCKKERRYTAFNYHAYYDAIMNTPLMPPMSDQA